MLPRRRDADVPREQLHDEKVDRREHKARSRALKVFLDTANLDEIEVFAKMGFIDGVTTNPTIIKKDCPGIDPMKWLERASERVSCVSWQVRPNDPLLQELLSFDRVMDDFDLLIKIPFCPWGFELLTKIAPSRVNLTGITSMQQAIMGCSLKPKILSIFWNRIKDHYEPDSNNSTGIAAGIVQTAANLRYVRCNNNEPLTEILVGSIRKTQDIADAAQAGADIITASPKIWRESMQSEATTKILEEWYGS